MSSTIKNILVIVGLLLIAALGYYLFTQRTGFALNSSQNDLVNTRAAAETEVFLSRLEDLKEIDLNKEFFIDQRFVTLQLYTTEVPAESVGRENPFQLNQ